MSIHGNIDDVHPRRKLNILDSTIPPEFESYARERCVRIKNNLKHVKTFDDSKAEFGSGVIIQTGLVFTNYHVIEEEGDITVNDNPAELIHFDLRNDLASLRVKTRKLSRVRMSEQRIFKSQPIFYVGNPDKYNKSVVPGTIVWGNRQDIRLSISAALGMSGSGIYDRQHGTLVGMVDSMKEGDTAFAIPVHHIRDFLIDTTARFFKKL